MSAVTSIVGSPRTPSKTADVATIFVDQIARASGWEARPAIELAGLATHMLDAGDPELQQAHHEVEASSVIVVASPTYQATYTGLLKLFLESLPAGALSARVVLPIMLAGTESHALAVRVHLAPMLEELGARVIAPLFIHERKVDQIRDIAREWWSANGLSLVSVVSLGARVR